MNPFEAGKAAGLRADHPSAPTRLSVDEWAAKSVVPPENRDAVWVIGTKSEATIAGNYFYFSQIAAQDAIDTLPVEIRGRVRPYGFRIPSKEPLRVLISAVDQQSDVSGYVSDFLKLWATLSVLLFTATSIGYILLDRALGSSSLPSLITCVHILIVSVGTTFVICALVMLISYGTRSKEGK